jgi:hypothetical protein
MRTKGPRFPLFVFLIVLSSLSILIASRSVDAGLDDRTPATAVADQNFVRKIDLIANDVVVDPTTQMLYASVPSRAGAKGNTITPVNGSTGIVGTPAFVGSEPNRMAISDNGQYIYVILDGAASIRRLSVTSQTAGLQFSPGLDQNHTIIKPRDLVVRPSNPGTVLVKSFDSGFGPAISVFDDGVQRGPALRNIGTELSLAFKPTDPSQLYVLGNNSSLANVSVTPIGLVLLNTINLISSGGSIQVDNGRLYTSNGQVHDPDTGAVLGTFTGTNLNVMSAFVSDSNVKRIYYLTAPFVNETQTTTLTLQVFDEQTFTPVGTLDIPNVVGRPTRIVRWGANGLAFTTAGGQLYTIQTTLIPSADPVPTPTPTPSPTPTPTPVPTPFPGELTLLPLVTKDLVVDPVTQLMYASVPSSAGAGGNSILRIDPVNGTTGPSVFVGSEPNKLAVSDGGEALYVGLDGSGALRRVDLSNLVPGLQFSLGTDVFFGNNNAGDIAVAPGQPNVVAVARSRPSVSPHFGGVAIYDNGVQRPSLIGNNLLSESIEFSLSPEVLYGQDTESTGADFLRIAVGSCGAVNLTATDGVGLSDFKVDNGIAFSSFGQAANPEIPVPLGRFVLLGLGKAFTIFPLVVPEVKAGRAYFLVLEDGVMVLRVYDTKTYLKVGELRLPGVTGTPSSLVRFGAHGIGFRTSDGQVWLLQNNLIGGQDPQFVAATPPPTPTATTKVEVTSFSDDPAGVTITTTGSLASTGSTDGTGKLTLNGVPPCGSLTVTPSKTNYTFFPASITTSTPVNATLSFSAIQRTLSFNVTSINVPESAGKLVIGISRNTSSTEPATVSFETMSNTASDRSDFNRTLGTLQFAPDDFTKQVTILITDDALVEGAESFTVKLSEATGAVLKPATSTLTVNIVDNDSSAGLNSLTNAQFFVRQQYQDFLNRAASDDPTGFNFWTNEITFCNAEVDPIKKADCLAVKRINVSAAFFLSTEFQQTGFLVHRLYTSSFPPSAARPRGLPRFMEFLRDTQQIGQGVVVGALGWEQKLEQNKQAFVSAWVVRPEFLAAHPETQTADQYVDSLFQNAGAMPTTQERSAAITAFSAGGVAGRAAALRSVAESLSVSNRQNSPAFVLMQYFGYLRRNPDDAPDGNFNGYQFWLDKLNQFNGNFVNAEMVKAFLLSTEYQQRFGPTNFMLDQ